MESKLLTTTIIIKTPPFSDISGKEGIDLALVCAAFEQNTQLIFTEAGILHLINEQSSEAINDKLHDKILKALEFYEIETIYCDQAALSNYSIDKAQLINNIKLVSTKEIANLVSQSNHTVTF